MSTLIENRDLVIQEVTRTLQSLDWDTAEVFCRDLIEAKKVFLVGVGRVELSLMSFCKRLSHLGLDVHMVGDICEPALEQGDLLVVGSGSGCSLVPVVIAKKAKQLGAKIVHIGSNPRGDVAEYIDYQVRIPVRTKLNLEDELPSQQIMTSLFEQVLLLFGDIVAKTIADRKDLDFSELWTLHANLE